MKRPTVASQKKVTPENLARLGAERLAELLAAAAAARPELKRRLRMELAAEQGAEHLALEIDRRLGSLETSRSKVSWRNRGSFVRDLDGLRKLIAERLADLDRAEARARLWRLMAAARRVRLRVRDRDGELAATFGRAAADLGRLLGDEDAERAAEALADAVAHDPAGWTAWLPAALEPAPPPLAEATLRRLSERGDAAAGWMEALRILADAAGNADAYRATYTAAALKQPSVAAEVAQRLLAAERMDEAGRLLQAAAPGQGGGLMGARAASPDEAWESAWIDYLERSGDVEAAQAARWAAFERTLSADRARAFVARLGGFDDVEAEERAFALAAAHKDFQRGLGFLMDWPALREAAGMIQARPDDVAVSPDLAELWAGRLRARHPAAAHLLLRKAAAAAFRRRDLATCDRLTAEADAIEV